MRRTTLFTGIVIATAITGASLVGCTSTPSLSGTVQEKYIEDFTEYTIVMKEGDGDIHHFTVTEEQFRATNIGAHINTANLDQPSED